MEIIRKKITLDQAVGEEISQILLEGDIIVPDTKPDMALVLQADANISIDKIETFADRINYAGKLNIQVLYLAGQNERTVHSISVSTSIDDFLNIEGAQKDSLVDFKADIQNIEYDMINDRKISYRAVVNTTVTVLNQEQTEIITDVEGLESGQKQLQNLTMKKIVLQKGDRFSIKDEISVPSGKPNIQEILQTNVSIINQEAKSLNGKIQITGTLSITTLYKGDDNENLLEFMEHQISFNGVLDTPIAIDEMFCDATTTVWDKYVQITSDDDGEDRIIELDITIGANIKLTTLQELEILEDAYSTTKELEMERKTISYPRFVCRNKTQNNVNELVRLGGEYPPILQIVRIKGKAHLDDVKVVIDKVVAEGAVEIDILYIASSDEMPLYYHKVLVPYRQIIEAKGADVHMNANVEIYVDNVNFSMQHDKEIDLRIGLTFATHVGENIETTMVQEINFLELDTNYIDSLPSITVYIVQKGDTLWKIAKKYNTTVSEIVELNDIDNPDAIYIGQKLLLLKKVI